jgi:transglutaminase-like putative cysteine protease
VSLPLALRVVLYLLVADGLVALHLAEFVGPAVTVAVAAGMAVSWWLARSGPALRPGFDRVLVPVAAVVSLVDVLLLAEVVLDGLVRLLLFLTLYKLITLRTVRDTRIVGFLAFFMLVAASSSAFGMGFLFVFVAFAVLATCLMLLQEFALEGQPTPGRRVVGAALGPVTGRRVAGLALVASLGAVVTTAVLFFVIPRVGLAALPFRLRTGPMVVGFTDRVELGAYGEIETDPTVVMRVHVPEWTPDPDRIPHLRWRGIVLDHFDGRAWTVGHPGRAARQRPGGDFLLALPRGTGRILVQDVYLEPLGTQVIFAAPRALALRLRVGDSVSVDDMDSLAVPLARARLRYTVVSEVERVPPVRPGSRRAPGPLDPETAARYLQLPPLPARIGELASRLTAGSDGPYAAAVRLSDHLSREFRYTLVLERQTPLNPVDEFLFVRRSGNCEYFAAALAVMLRSIGTPARVVNGFQRGEWNPYGHYFMVRLRDAHSWVEAYVPGLGWVTLDPSPRGEATAPGAFGALSLYFDSLRMRWHRYVINWSLRDQIQAAGALRGYAAGWRPDLTALRDWEQGRLPALGGAAIVLVVAALMLGRRWGPGARGGRRAPGGVPPFYARALARLARRGLAPAPGETAREFAHRVGQVAPGCATPFTRLTVAYEQARFGGVTPAHAEAAALDACLASLARP